MKLLFSAFLFYIFSISLSAQNQDCETAITLLTKDSIVVDELNGPGEIDDDFDNECSPFGPTEFNSSWYNFTAFEAGSFNFTIKPSDPTNDLDFFLFKTESDQCDLTERLRCNATSCLGSNGYTGLASNDNDLFEDLNCNPGENGYCSEVQLEEGYNYFFMINNFTGNEGYTVVFCGTAKLSPDDIVCTDEILDTKEKSEKTIIVSPNPTHGYIKIQDYQEIESIEVINLHGMVVNRISHVKENLYLDLPAGQYYLKMLLIDGKTAVARVLFIKQ